MSIIELRNLSKSYGATKAVDDLSFDIQKGEILGFIGQNGSGKTTTIRMMLDILDDYGGNVGIHLDGYTGNVRDHIGYLPEERGLYLADKVIDSIAYFGRLKGLDRKLALQRAEELLKKVDLYEHRQKKVSQLSKGMGQLVQFIVSIVHDPDILILDEPFSGLDPSNADVIKNLILSMKCDGKTIFFSAHNMHDVESLCDRIIMIKGGKKVLYGTLDEIRSQFWDADTYLLDANGDWSALKGLCTYEPAGEAAKLKLLEGVSSNELLMKIGDCGLDVVRFEKAIPDLNEIFLRIAGDDHE